MSVEKVLLKLAGQLSAFDEASIMSLWEKYAQQVSNFEPSKRWEESVLIFGMIQAMRFKNQLFNYHWSEGGSPSKCDAPPCPPDFPKPVPDNATSSSGPASPAGPASITGKPHTTKKSVKNATGGKDGGRGKVLEFKPKEEG